MDQTENTKHVFNSCASEYQDRFMNVDLYADTLGVFCDSMKIESARILEIACGPGNITKYLLEKRPDFKIFGIDLAENMITLAKTNNPQAKFEVMDCRQINMLNEKYDGIMCGFCLPYISKPETFKLIKDSAQLLKENGVLYLSTMEDDYEKSGLKKSSSGKYETYQYFHEAAYLKQALEENGFRINTLKRQDYPVTNGAKVVDLILIAQKKCP